VKNLKTSGFDKNATSKDQIIQTNWVSLADRKNKPAGCKQIIKNHATGPKMGILRNRPDLCNQAVLILQAQKGDLDSFNQVVLAYQDSIFNTALYILGDHELAADLTQEAFIAAFQNIEKYRGGTFRAWLTRIVMSYAAKNDVPHCHSNPSTKITKNSKLHAG
jgi:hypothetical protein